jgi:hypothetical protein
MSTAAEDVWRLVARADDLVKYAPNRDRTDAYRQARETLERAAGAAAGLADRTAAAGLTAQIQRRLEDLTRVEDAR